MQNISENSLLGTNDVSVLTVVDAVATKDGTLAPLTFRRREAPLNFIDSVIIYESRPPPPPRETRPPKIPENVVLQTKPGELIGSGHSGLVFAAESPTILDKTSSTYIPPLVFKFAAPNRNKYIAREAWFYDELESLQGVVVPRCYGWFEADLPAGCDFIPWKASNDDEEDPESDEYVDNNALHGEAQSISINSLDETCQSYRDDSDPNKSSDRGDSHGERRFRRLGGFKETSRVLLDRLGGKSCVTLLLLERVGDYFLPIGEEISADVEKEVYDAYRELAEFRIEHGDVRYQNILRALDSPPGLPGLPSPYHRRIFSCRIIDFEIARKTNDPPECNAGGTGSWLKGLLDNLPSGQFLNQNDDW